jgi:hypothetical protein
MADIDLSGFPSTYTIHTDDDLLSDIHIKELPELTLHTDNDLLSDIHIKELPVLKLEAAIKEIPLIRTDNKIDAGLDNIQIKELPVVRLKVGLDPTRVHMPGNWKFGVSVLGLPIVSFDVCGESMVVIEDYIRHKAEECE